MPKAHGKDAYFAVDDSGGTLRNISQYVDSVSGLPGGRALSDVTGFTDQGERSVPGLATASFTVSGSYDSTATTGPQAVLNGLRSTTATATFEFGPDSNTTGRVKFTGECWLESYVVDTTVAEKVPFSAQFKLDGVVTTTVF